MALEPYKDREWLYHYYVQKRMNLKDIVELLSKKHNINVTTQAIYNWCVKYDLLKYRGKGRKIGANMQGGKKPNTMGKSPRQLQAERMRAAARAKKKSR